MIFIWFLRWLNSSNFLTGIIVTWSPREINPIALSSSSRQQMLDWLHFHFNLCPISYVATDLISSQYSDCVFSSLHPDAHQMVTVEPGPVASLTSFLCLLETKIARCQDITTFLSFSVCVPGKLAWPRVSPVWGLAPGRWWRVSALSLVTSQSQPVRARGDNRQQWGTGNRGQVKCLGTVSDHWFFEISRKIFTTLLLVWIQKIKYIICLGFKQI